MDSVVINPSELKGELREQVNLWLENTKPDLIAFPYKGKHMRGFLFRWNSVSYFIIQSVVTGKSNDFNEKIRA